MLTFILTVIWAVLALSAISLQKAYSQVPVKELKRRARSGDKFASLLYKAVGHGAGLEVLLWLLIGIFSSILFVVLAVSFEPWLAVLLVAILIWFGYVWVPSTRLSKIGLLIARFATPCINWLLNYLGPPLERVGNILERHRPFNFHTGLYQKEDLVELITQQQVQVDNRIDEEALRLAANALTFGEKKIQKYVTPRRVVKSISADDTIGPIFLTELHDSGHSRFPVYQGEKDHIVGILMLRDLVNALSGGKVGDFMSKDVVYVHEEEPLEHALKAFLKTQKHLFIVVNSFEEYVGVLSIEDVLEQILGRKIVDEFDQYDDMRAVAAFHAGKEHKDHQKSEVSEPNDKPAE